MEDLKLDVLAFGAHPDDVEITSGGTMCKMKKMGYATGIIDLTQGEMGTYGNIEKRAEESENAATILQLDVRKNLGFPDGRLANTPELREKIVRTIRTYRPEILLAPFTETRHPDHAAAGQAVKEACFLAGLEKNETGQQKFRPSAVIFYPEHNVQTPDFAVDISEEWEVKLQSIQAHQSQVYDGDDANNTRGTFIKSRQFSDLIYSRYRYYGIMTGVEFAEVFYYQGIPRVDDILSAFRRNVK